MAVLAGLEIPSFETGIGSTFDRPTALTDPNHGKLYEILSESPLDESDGCSANSRPPSPVDMKLGSRETRDSPASERHTKHQCGHKAVDTDSPLFSLSTSSFASARHPSRPENRILLFSHLFTLHGLPIAADKLQGKDGTEKD